MTWNEVLQLLALLAAAITAIGGSVKIVDLLKKWFGLSGFGAQLLAWGVNGLISVLNALLVGQIVPGMGWVEILGIVIMLFIGQTQLYRAKQRSLVSG